jgi:RNA polymerase sigma-70 factor (ECF subfamily)
MTLLDRRSRRSVVFPARLDETEETDERTPQPADSDTPEACALSQELGHYVNAAIDELPDGQRTAIVLRHLQGLSYQEVAIAMGSPVGTVRSRISRARDALEWALQWHV